MTKMNEFLTRRLGRLGLVAGIMPLLVPLPRAGAVEISEPDTVFYGKVLTRSGPQTHLVTSGLLTWKVLTPDGVELGFETRLDALKNGEFSYRLNIPQQAKSLGLALDAGVVVVGREKQTHEHLSIFLDGVPARILAPGTHSFGVDYSARAGTQRLDLEVDLDLPDTDGDGLPDWWEEAHGLDPQSADADGDPDGDGLTNLAEFLGGSDPNHDSREPSLLTTELIAHAGGTSGMPLKVADSDSAPGDLTYTLVRGPGEGLLALRNARKDPQAPDKTLAAGDTFSQDDVNRGRVVFVHTAAAGGTASASTTFAVSVRDEDDAHPAGKADVTVWLYRPANLDEIVESRTPDELLALARGGGPLPTVPVEEEWRVRSYLLCSQGDAIVWEFPASSGGHVLAAPSSGMGDGAPPVEYLLHFGPDRTQIVLGGPGDDRISGGMAGDILAGGAGTDTLRGDLGADRFIMLDADGGSDLILDFREAEGDVLDLTRILQGATGLLSDHVAIRNVNGDAIVGIDVDGDGSGFTDVEVVLQDSGLGGGDLHRLWSGGNLVAGGLGLPPEIGVVAVQEARENGRKEGVFRISRLGLLDAPLAIAFTIGGSATNGVDYAAVSPAVTIPAGESSALVPIKPFADALVEGPEVVELILSDGSSYQIGAAGRASMTILDLLPEISIEALQPLASRESGQRGVFLVTRSEVIDRSVLVRFSLSGTAVNGTDYVRVPAFLNMLPGQATALIEIAPLGAAGTGRGEGWVDLSLVADPTYVAGAAPRARVVVADHERSLEDWRNENFPGVAGSLAEFATTDPGGHGVPVLLRYAFGLDPRNPRRPDSLARLPVVRMHEGRPAISFPQFLAATDVAYVVEISDDLRNWRSDPDTVEEVPAETPGWVRYRSKASADSASSLFLRVRLQR